MPGPGGGLSDIDRLTNAAISAAMAADRLYGDSPSSGYRDGNTAIVRSDGVLRWANGDPYDPPYDYTSDWNSWRSAIQELVTPWESRPAYGPFDSSVSALTKASNRLQPSTKVEGSGTGSSTSVGGSLRDAIGSLTGDLSGMTSDALIAFRHRYADHLQTINEGQFALAVVGGECVAAEREIWDRADRVYRELVEQATQAFLAARDFQIFGGGGSVGATELKVAGAVLAGIGLFVSGGTFGAVLKGASFGVRMLKDFAPGSAQGPTLKIKGGTANAVLASFSHELDRVRDEIEKQERAIHDCLTANLRTVKHSPHKFDLASPPLLNEADPNKIGIKVQTNIMRACGNETCPRVAQGFRDAAHAADGAFGSEAWARPSYFGASTGSYPEFAELLGELQYAAKNTAYEITKAGKLLVLAADYLDEADHASHAQLEKIRAKIHRLEESYDEHYPQRPDSEGNTPPRAGEAVDGWAMSGVPGPI